MATKKVAASTKKVVDGMKGLFVAAKEDLTANSQGIKQDFRDMLDAARTKRRGGKRPKTAVLLDVSVNPDAGSEILTHNKEEWSAIHKQTEESFQASMKLDEELLSIQTSLSHSHVIITNCCAEFSGLPEVVKAVETAKEQVVGIRELLGKVEESIMEYCRVRAKLESERKRSSLKIQYENHKAEADLEKKKLEGVLAEHKRLMLETEEAIESQKIQERQQAFQAIFDQQMAEYKTRGEVERPIGVDVKERSDSQLEDVVIEDKEGTDSLNEFLGDVVVNGGEESHDQPGESHDQPGESHDQPGESHDQPGGTHDQPGGSHDQPGGSHDQPGGSHDQPRESHDQPGGSHDQPGESRSHDRTEKQSDSQASEEEDVFQDCT